MGVLDCGAMAAKGFWDNFGMRHLENIFQDVRQAEMPDAVIVACDYCEEKHMLNPYLHAMKELGDAVSIVAQAQRFTTEAREMMGDLSLMAWWWSDRFDRRTIEMAQQALERADIDEETRQQCVWKLDWALYFLTNAETIAQEIVVSL